MTSIYHITHLQNLPAILASGELLSDSGIRARNLVPTSIAHGHIKERRARTIIDLPPGGVVSDYVPFYFCPRSPMLYAIHGGSVQGYPGGQSKVLHLVADAEELAAQLPCVHTDGNAATMPLQLFAGTTGFERLSWDVIRSWSWRDTAEDNDRKRRKQAEFLVWRAVPWTAIRRIGVFDAPTAAEVLALLPLQTAPGPTVELQPDWYYR